MPRTFDEAELLERVGDDTEFLAETVQMLADDGPALMEQVRRAIEAGDAAAVGTAAHTLKGMISNFAAAEAQQSALDVERIGKGGTLAAAPEAAEQLAQHLNALIAELQQFVQSRQ